MSACARPTVLVEVLRPWWIRIPLLVVVVLGAALIGGFRINVSRSLPLGLYRVMGETSAVARGSIVIVCLPREWAVFALQRRILGPGRCEGGSYGLGKMVVAVGGDTVAIHRTGVLVNGRPVPETRVLEQDSHRRPIPHYPWGTFVLSTWEFWLASPFHQSAFDSRYFGPIARSRVQSVIQPVWTERPIPASAGLVEDLAAHRRAAAPPGLLLGK